MPEFKTFNYCTYITYIISKLFYRVILYITFYKEVDEELSVDVR